MSNVSLLFVQVPAENRDELVKYFEEKKILQVSGASHSQLLVDNKDPGKVVVIAWWDSPDAYQKWLEAPVREEFGRDFLKISNNKIESSSFDLRIVSTVE